MGKKVEVVTADDVREMLKGKIGYNHGVRALAKQLGVSQGYMSDVLSGKRAPGPKILAALGFSPEPVYVKAA